MSPQKKLNFSLHEAAIGGKVGDVIDLLQRGAEVDSRDQKGRTALHHAAFWKNEEVGLALLEHGANVNARNNNGDAPLHTAGLKGEGGLVLAMIARGADVNALNLKEENPLRLAVHEAGQHDIGLGMIAHGANPLCLNPWAHKPLYGMPSVHAAVRADLLDQLVKLLDGGADPHEAHHGLSAFDVAAQLTKGSNALGVLQAWEARRAIETIGLPVVGAIPDCRP